jgi:Mn-containing catalase
MPEGVPIEIAPERREEFSPGLDAELLEMIQVTAEQELRKVDELGKG